jgi:hypothetical protein
MESFSLALQVTLIGLSLVFGSILLLWIVMSALVRLTADRSVRESTARPATSLEADREIKRRAAAAAVATVLVPASQQPARALPLPPTASVSAWQAVMRAGRLNQRGPVR